MTLKVGLVVLELAGWLGGATCLQQRQSGVREPRPAVTRRDERLQQRDDGAEPVVTERVAYAVRVTRVGRTARGEETKSLAGLGTVLMGAAGFCVWMSARSAGAKDVVVPEGARDV